MSSTKEYFDFIFVIPLELELEEFLSVFPVVEDRTTAQHFRVVVDLGTTEFRGLAILQDAMGYSSAARCLRSCLREYDCGLAVCIGIAGALSDDLNLLDVCYTGDLLDVGENARVSDDESGALLIDFNPTHRSTKKTLTQALNYARIVPAIKLQHEKWSRDQLSHAQKTIADNGVAVKDSTLSSAPKSLNGTIVCGPLVKSENYKKRLFGLNRKLHAIEMEAGGVFEAASEFSQAIDCLVVRGISDNADKDKSQLEQTSKGLFRKLAAANAATFFKMQLSNPYFTRLIKSKRGTPEEKKNDEQQVEPVSIAAKELSEEIYEKLRQLSPEFRLQPKGYRLPLPRLQMPQTVATSAEKEEQTEDTQLYCLDVIRRGRHTLLVLPRTYPDNSLSYVIADSLIECEFDGKQVLPFVIDGGEIRPPKFGFQTSHPGYDLEALTKNKLAHVIILVEDPPLKSKTRRAFLASQLMQFEHAQFVIIVREDANDFEASSFLSEHNFTSYRVGEISFSEIAHFVQKNFGLEGREADVVALRIRDTLRRFRLAVHPTYFAGVAKELLNALLVANRRSELIQLAVDGYLTLLVADDLSDVTLSRSTRERFLRRLAVEIRIEKRSFSMSEVVQLAQEFAAEYDFNIDALSFVSDFVDKGIIGFSHGRAEFYLPFIEHYLLASYLTENPGSSSKYFNIDEDEFDLATFDLYAEMGPAEALVNGIASRMKSAISELERTLQGENILLTGEIRPQLLSKPEVIEKTQHRLMSALSNAKGNEDSRSEKQAILDVSDGVTEQAVRERREKSEEISKSALDDFSRIDRVFFIGVVLLGLGSETLVASRKAELASDLLRLGSLLVDRWTRVNNKVKFSDLKTRLVADGMLERMAKFGLSSQEALALIDDLLGFLELAFLSYPFRRVLESLCEQARSRVLATTLAKIVPEGKFEKLILALWMSDIDSKAGTDRLRDVFRELPTAVFLRSCVSTHLLTRVFWNHWNAEDRLRLLDAASDTLQSLGRGHDKGKIKRMVTREKTREDGGESDIRS